MTLMTRHTLLLPLTLTALLFAGLANAADDGILNPLPCPVTTYNPAQYGTIDEEFGVGVQANTQCLRNRNNAKVVISVGHTFPFTPAGTPQKARATFFSNLDHLVRNYENMHGMTVGKDVEIAVVLLESGAFLAANETFFHPVFDTATPPTPKSNPFISLVNQAMSKGIKIYLCQTAARNLGLNASNTIPGIKWVPGGHIAVADFQLQGYALIAP